MQLLVCTRQLDRLSGLRKSVHERTELPDTTRDRGLIPALNLSRTEVILSAHIQYHLKIQKMQQRYMLELGSLHDPKKIIHIIAYPKMPAEQREYRVAEVLLDPNTYLPQAVQLMDTTGNKETVYVFSKHDNVVGPWLPTAPWKPSLFGFKEIMNQRADPPAEREAKGAPLNTGIMLR